MDALDSLVLKIHLVPLGINLHGWIAITVGWIHFMVVLLLTDAQRKRWVVYFASTFDQQFSCHRLHGQYALCGRVEIRSFW